GRIGKRRVFGVPAWVGVTVRRDDREVLDAVVEPARNHAGGEVGGEKSVGMGERGGEASCPVRIHDRRPPTTEQSMPIRRRWSRPASMRKIRRAGKRRLLCYFICAGRFGHDIDTIWL